MAKREGTVLVVDDEPGLREMLTILFKREGYDVAHAPGFVTGRDAVRNAPAPYGVVLTDLMMPDGSGLDIVTAARDRSEHTQVIVMTAHSTLDTAIDAMKRGAYDFITKPFSTGELKVLVEKALEKRALSHENQKLRAQVVRQTPKELVGHSPAMARVHDLVSKIAGARTTVLITGESGVGKERIARSIHEGSERGSKPFLVVNCGAIPETLIESELFGHEKGAFTGAVVRKLGIFREADGGTVFLDEIGELPLQMQVKLLRVLQERKVRGVGEAQESSVDVRVVSATNKNLEEEVKQSRFRQDLFYRLNVIRVEVPPLRARKEDIVELANYFLARCANEHNKEVRGFSPDALRSLSAYDFPGNVRELENLIERAVALAAGPQLGLGDLPREVSGQAASPTPELGQLPEAGCNLDEVIGELERRLILQALERSGGVRTNAAKLLGVTFRSLRYRLQKLALDVGDDELPSGESLESGQFEAVSSRRLPDS